MGARKLFRLQNFRMHRTKPRRPLHAPGPHAVFFSKSKQEPRVLVTGRLKDAVRDGEDRAPRVDQMISGRVARNVNTRDADDTIILIIIPVGAIQTIVKRSGSKKDRTHYDKDDEKFFRRRKNPFCHGDMTRLPSQGFDGVLRIGKKTVALPSINRPPDSRQ